MKALRGTLLTMMASCQLWGQTSGTAQHLLNYSVPPVCALSIVDYSSPYFMYDIFPAEYGPQLATIEDANSTYSISNNMGAGQVMSSRLSNDLPPGITITTQLIPPKGANSHTIELSTADQTVLTSIGMGAFPDNQIIYFVYADDDARRAQYSFHVNIIYTLIGGSQPIVYVQ